MRAPQVTPADVEAAIASEHYFTAHEGVAGAGPVIAAEFWHRTNGHAIVDYSEQTHVGHLSKEKGYERRPLVHRPEPTGPLAMLTYCVLVLKNGHIVSGEAYCADPAKFNAETGRIEARKAAINKLWPMVVYAERERLAAPPSIPLTQHEVQSGSTRVHWAEGLIRQLPDDHDGRNSWLLNYGSDAAERQAEWAKHNPNSSLVRGKEQP